MKMFVDLIFLLALIYVAQIFVGTLGIDVGQWWGMVIYAIAVVALVFWIVVLSKKTEVVLMKDKAVLVKGHRKYTVYKSDDGQIFENRNDFLIKNNASELDKKIKVGNKYKIVSYKFNLMGDRNLLTVQPIKSSVRMKSGKKLK